MSGLPLYTHNQWGGLTLNEVRYSDRSGKERCCLEGGHLFGLEKFVKSVRATYDVHWILTSTFVLSKEGLRSFAASTGDVPTVVLSANWRNSGGFTRDDLREDSVLGSLIKNITFEIIGKYYRPKSPTDRLDTWGTFHPKFCLIFTKEGLAISITTSNLTRSTSLEGTWSAFVAKADQSSRASASVSDFGIQLQRFLEACEENREKNLSGSNFLCSKFQQYTHFKLEDLHKQYDFASLDESVRLVTTVPGRRYVEYPKDLPNSNKMCEDCRDIFRRVTPAVELQSSLDRNNEKIPIFYGAERVGEILKEIHQTKSTTLLTKTIEREAQLAQMAADMDRSEQHHFDAQCVASKFEQVSPSIAESDEKAEPSLSPSNGQDTHEHKYEREHKEEEEEVRPPGPLFVQTTSTGDKLGDVFFRVLTTNLLPDIPYFDDAINLMRIVWASEQTTRNLLPQRDANIQRGSNPIRGVDIDEYDDLLGDGTCMKFMHPKALGTLLSTAPGRMYHWESIVGYGDLDKSTRFELLVNHTHHIKTWLRQSHEGRMQRRQRCKVESCTCTNLDWCLLTSACMSIGAQGTRGPTKVCKDLKCCMSTNSKLPADTIIQNKENFKMFAYSEHRNFELGVFFHTDEKTQFRALDGDCPIHLPTRTGWTRRWPPPSPRAQRESPPPRAVVVLPIPYKLSCQSYHDPNNSLLHLPCMRYQGQHKDPLSKYMHLFPLAQELRNRLDSALEGQELTCRVSFQIWGDDNGRRRVRKNVDQHKQGQEQDGDMLLEAESQLCAPQVVSEEMSQNSENFASVNDSVGQPYDNELSDGATTQSVFFDIDSDDTSQSVFFDIDTDDPNLESVMGCNSSYVGSTGDPALKRQKVIRS